MSRSHHKTALVVTPYAPMAGGVVLQGAYLRFSLFLRAIKEIVDQIVLVHIASPRTSAEECGLVDPLNSELTAKWGTPVSAHFLAPRSRRETFVNHYLSGILSVYEQKHYFAFSGPEQAAGIGKFLDQEHDLVFVHKLSAMLAVLRSGRRLGHGFFDLDDVEHRIPLQRIMRPPFWPGKLFYLAQVPAIAAAERRGIAISSQTFVCSELDRSRLMRLGARGVTAIPNAVFVPSEVPPPPSAPTVLFLGNLLYDPNVEAAERLVRRILPRIRAAVPDAQLLIAGNGSRDLPSGRDCPDGVHYLGFAEDLPALYASARVICCPISQGSGTRLKLVEAASYARPMVATRMAAEGLEFRDGEEIWLREDDDDIAAACVHLLRDDALCHRLGFAARARMREKYDADVIHRDIIRIMRSEMARPAA